MSEENKSQNRGGGNKRRHNNRNRNNNKNNNRSGGGGGGNRNHNNRKRNFSKNRRPKSLTPTKILQKYDNLMEQYIVARKKYFDTYGRNSTRNLAKVERNYQEALKKLREFETNLKEEWQKEVLAKKIDGYKPDREYTTNHDLKPEGDIVSFTGEFEDPHLLATQKEHQWSEDTEESSGTMEDYEKYKASQL